MSTSTTARRAVGGTTSASTPKASPPRSGGAGRASRRCRYARRALSRTSFPRSGEQRGGSAGLNTAMRPDLSPRDRDLELERAYSYARVLGGILGLICAPFLNVWYPGVAALTLYLGACGFGLAYLW